MLSAHEKKICLLSKAMAFASLLLLAIVFLITAAAEAQSGQSPTIVGYMMLGVIITQIVGEWMYKDAMYKPCALAMMFSGPLFFTGVFVIGYIHDLMEGFVG